MIIIDRYPENRFKEKHTSKPFFLTKNWNVLNEPHQENEHIKAKWNSLSRIKFLGTVTKDKALASLFSWYFLPPHITPHSRNICGRAIWCFSRACSQGSHRGFCEPARHEYKVKEIQRRIPDGGRLVLPEQRCCQRASPDFYFSRTVSAHWASGFPPCKPWRAVGMATILVHETIPLGKLASCDLALLHGIQNGAFNDLFSLFLG